MTRELRGHDNGVMNTKLGFLGFTLVELLVVIAILAVLTTISVIQYWGINARARDSARRADIHEIATALEVNKTNDSYIPLQQSQFSTFSWSAPAGDVYCIGVGNPSDPAVSESWGSSCPEDYVTVAPGAPGGSFLSWKICTYLENAGSGSNVFCKSSRQ